MNEPVEIHRGGKRYSIYAANAGKHIKIGLSSDIQKRIREIQVGNPFEVEVVWEKYIGSDSRKARDTETAIHAACDEFHVRGEWFDYQCLTLLRDPVRLQEAIDAEARRESRTGAECDNPDCDYKIDAEKWRRQQERKKEGMRRKRAIR